MVGMESSPGAVAGDDRRGGSGSAGGRARGGELGEFPDEYVAPAAGGGDLAGAGFEAEAVVVEEVAVDHAGLAVERVMQGKVGGVSGVGLAGVEAEDAM